MKKLTVIVALCFCVACPLHGESFQEVKERAEQGDIYAYYDLVTLYFFGQGGAKKDEAMGVIWYRKSAENGDWASQYALGLIYGNGQGVEQDFEESVKWFRKAAEQNCYFSAHALGSAYAKGEGVAQNDSLAIMWYEKAAQQGYVKSAAALGMAYYSGRLGVRQNFPKAAEWLHVVVEKKGSEDLSAEQIAFFQYRLGRMYFDGKGVPQNYTEAIKWLYKSSEGGEKGAMGWLGFMYYEGQGLVQSNTMAHMWLNLASAHGDTAAARFRDGIAKYMTSKQISEAQDRALEWMEKNQK